MEPLTVGCCQCRNIEKKYIVSIYKSKKRFFCAFCWYSRCVQLLTLATVSLDASPGKTFAQRKFIWFAKSGRSTIFLIFLATSPTHPPSGIIFFSNLSNTDWSWMLCNGNWQIILVNLMGTWSIAIKYNKRHRLSFAYCDLNVSFFLFRCFCSALFSSGNSNLMIDFDSFITRYFRTFFFMVLDCSVEMIMSAIGVSKIAST